MFSALVHQPLRAVAALVLCAGFVACGGSDDHERTIPECSGRECEGGAGGLGGSGNELLDCPGLCREVAACSGESDPGCSGDCESTVAMAASLGCGLNYAGYVNCVLDAGDACVRVRPPECTVAYDELDACLCAAFPEGCL